MNEVRCPICGVKLNMKTDAEVDFDIRRADSKIWCIPCQRYIKFSLKHKDKIDIENKDK